MLKILAGTLLDLLDGKLFARLILLGTDTMADDRRNDPAYKQNVQRLIERSRRFEDARK
ncbi:hypothetical protein [Bradyrhizobium sp. SZCCHNPS2010]|uniref:hypothetical protein n=1 Tax=Bradyrhizobium sp. SZCCHNPS2010 TaxID=3057333 RepID=UPI00291607E9|nr:hypothetical protein [Bradyrhizobium sp. SZCCHNPS2010]